MEMYFKRMKDEWTGLVEQADPPIRAKAAEIAVAHAHYLSIEFYRIVRIDPHAEEFLSNEQVERQLKSAMERWIINVLSAQVDDVERLIQIQHTVAEVHARIGIPVEIVEMGFRVLKKILYPVIFSSDYSAAEKLQVYHFSINSIDIAMEVMTRAFTFSDSSASKEDENYRIFSLLENAEEEKERQIASILSWEIDIIYKILLDSDLGSSLPLSQADFGLWFNHKGRHYFREVAIKWSAAPDMTPQTVLYRRPVAQFSNFQPKIVSSWLILARFQANFLISGRSRLCPYQLVNSNQVRQGE